MLRLNKTRHVVAVLVALATVLPATAAFGAGVVNINTADRDELTLLPRVGPSLADRIVAFREENGAFEATEELILVRGIGETTFEMLEPFVSVKGETTLKEKASVPRAARSGSDV